MPPLCPLTNWMTGMVGNCKAVETALNSSSSGTVGDAKDAVPIVDADAGSNSQGNASLNENIAQALATAIDTTLRANAEAENANAAAAAASSFLDVAQNALRSQQHRRLRLSKRAFTSLAAGNNEIFERINATIMSIDKLDDWYGRKLQSRGNRFKQQ